MRNFLHFAVLLCLIGVVFGQYVPVCDPANYTDPLSIPLPILPAQFSVVVEANFGQDNRTSDMKEYVDEVGNRGRFELSSTNFGTNTVVGIFDYNNGEIFVIPDGNTGDACAVKPIADPSTRPFLPQTPSFGFQDVNGTIQIGTVSRFFQLLRNTTNATWLGVEVVRGIPCNRWQTCTAMQSSSYTLDYYFAAENWDFALGNGPTPVQVILTAANSRGSLRHTYSFVSFKTGPRSVPDDVFTVPIGVVCTGRTPGPPIPPFPDYFSISLEAVQRAPRSVVVYKEFHDPPNSLSRVDVYHDGREGGSPGPITRIYDSARQIDYIINKQFKNCTVTPFNEDLIFFTPLEGPSVEVAKLFSVHNVITYALLLSFSYEGVTNIRGVDVDAWIGVRPDFSGRISTTTFITTPGSFDLRNVTWELFATRPGWRITTDRTVNTEPALWRIKLSGHITFTFDRDNTTTSGLYSASYEIFDFSSEEPDFDMFDVSACFSPSEYHVLSLAVPGHEQGLNFSQLRRNLRTAIVNYSTIQPLQVGNIQITGENGTHIFVSLQISNPTPLATTDDSKTADEILQMIQRNTVNGRLPFQISTGLGMTMVTPLLLNVNPQVCDGSCSGLNNGHAAGLGIGLLIVGLVCGILGTLLVLLVIRLCRSKSTTLKDAPVNYKKQEDEVPCSKH